MTVPDDVGTAPQQAGEGVPAASFDGDAAAAYEVNRMAGLTNSEDTGVGVHPT